MAKVREYNKLVRDRIPEIIRSRGKYPIIHKATKEEYEIQLDRKLVEEVREYLGSRNPEELIDVLEVVDAICENRNLTREKLEKMRLEKANEKGKFLERTILDAVE